MPHSWLYLVNLLCVNASGTLNRPFLTSVPSLLLKVTISAVEKPHDPCTYYTYSTIRDTH